MKSLVAAVLALLLLSGCAGQPAVSPAGGTVEAVPAPSFPEAYRIVCRMETWRNGERAYFNRFTAVSNGAGFYYRNELGDEYLYLADGPETYSVYRREDGSMVPSETPPISRQVLRYFQTEVLGMDLLLQDVTGLTPGDTAEAAGRTCRVYAGETREGERTVAVRCLVDPETGLTLDFTRTYRWEGGELRYQVVCESLETEEVALPALALETVEKGASHLFREGCSPRRA